MQHAHRILCLLVLLISPLVLFAEDKKPAKKEETLTPEQIKKIVTDYLKEKEQKDKKKAAEAKEKDKKKEDPAYVVGEETEFRVFWRNGLRMATKDGAFKVHVGGRIHSDFTWWNSEDAVEVGPLGVGRLQDGGGFRRARIRVNGTMYETITWLMEYGFESGSPAFFDVYGDIKSVPVVGNFRIGHFREPFSLDALTAGNELTFVERSLIQDAFVPFRNLGIMIHDRFLDGAASWALGGFRSVSNAVAADAGERNYAVTGRLTWNPWYEQGRYAMHFGIAASHRHNPLRNGMGMINPVTGLPRVRFATRPEERINAPRFVDTGFIIADNTQLLGAEFALGTGPFLLQTEYVLAFNPNTSLPGDVGNRGTAMFHGGYIQLSYFLTGEHRPYSRTRAVFGRATPYENAFHVKDECCGHRRGWGAWELGTRYSYINLNDQGIQGGILHNWTVGLNWHLNRSSRFMCNYILSYRDVAGTLSDGLTRILAARYQIDF